MHVIRFVRLNDAININTRSFKCLLWKENRSCKKKVKYETSISKEKYVSVAVK